MDQSKLTTERKVQLYRAPRGTADILPQDQPYWRYVEATAKETAQRFGYQRIDTPVFEDAGLFVRSIGEVTDIVQKETYTFEDRSGDMLTLRPEGTAPVCRAYLEHGMHNLPQPVRLFYFCPIFRYERPQAGRFRQHHQFGIEALGDADPAVDAEIIEIGWQILTRLGLKGLSLLVNTIGDSQCRPEYIEALKGYYAGYDGRICKDCKTRLERNPMRLLDCKEESCQPVIAGAPRYIDYLCDPCQEHWDTLLSYLSALELPYQINHRLVRGFDYYTRTVFEIQPPVEGAQSTILGGGRYDGLIQELGGKPTPGVGFGMGMERVILNLRRQEVALPKDAGEKVIVAYLGDAAKREAVALALKLRQEGVSVVLAPGGRSLKGQMRHASALGAAHAIIIGDEELKKRTVIERDLAKGKQREDDLVSKLGAPSGEIPSAFAQRRKYIEKLNGRTAKLEQKPISEFKERILKSYLDATLPRQVTTVSQVWDLNASAFQIIPLWSMIKLQEFNDPTFWWGPFCADIGREMASRERIYLQNQILQHIGEDTVNISYANPDFNLLTERIERLAQRDLEPNVIMVPIGLSAAFTKFHMSQMAWPAGGPVRLKIGTTELKVFWSHRYAPLDKFIIFSSRAGIWSIIPDPQTKEAITIAIGQSNLYPDEVEFGVETIVKYQLVNPDAFCVIPLSK